MNNNDFPTTDQQTLELRGMVWLSIATTVALTLFSLWGWGQLPEGAPIPVHWNAAGEVDRYGSVFEGFFLMPLMILFVSGLFYVIPRIDPRGQNIAQSATAFKAAWVGMLLFLTIMHVAIVLNTLGYAVNIGLLVPVMVGILFLVIGNYMGKIRSNFMFGIRTPWTLTSELSWNKTHRLGGRLFMLLGLLMIATGLLPISEAWVFVMIGAIFGMIAILFVYSYIVYRSDPEV